MNIYKSVFFLTPFVLCFALGLDIYIPVIPELTEIFETTPPVMHLTLSLFLSTTGVGQLLMGPLSDKYGRKIVFSRPGGNRDSYGTPSSATTLSG